MQWTTLNIYVDLETGEKLKDEWIKDYTIIRKKKHVHVKYKTTKNPAWGFITYTNECRRKPKQGGLWDRNTLH